MVPAPRPLFDKFRAALAALGGRSANRGRFEALSAAAYASGAGRWGA